MSVVTNVDPFMLQVRYYYCELYDNALNSCIVFF